ncbi:regulator of chromosome condensation 1/beta-lactamase-inhibitor protein II [Chytriomyces cf. hyalinus JEL632]|nr:regulator of chromosome condensation 1/beta-lactamase-inhibitor protein II [Chytriomyces cf. hyalinus JEL632]
MAPRTTRSAAADAQTSSPKRIKVTETKHKEVKEVKEPKAPARVKKTKEDTFTRLVPASTTTGEVFIVGAGDCGQLGLGPDVTSATKLKKLTYFEDKNIVEIAAGGLHNMALSSDGKVYSWGCNDQMALGRGGEETEPAPVEGLDGVVIVQVVCGDSVTAALSDVGQVYAWGTFRNKNGIFGFRPDIDIQARPFLIPELSRIVSIKAGADHIVAFTLERKIFTWGCGESGQLGRKILSRMEKERSLTPKELTFKPRKSQIEANPTNPLDFPKIPGVTFHSAFVSVHCGGHQTFLVHESGTVFACGLNNHGQLGVGDQDEYDQFEPFGELVDNEDKERDVDHPGFKEVVGSEHHAIALDRAGRVYTFGRNDDGQLGTGGSESVSNPHLLAKPANVISVSANGAFTCAVTEDNDFEGNNLWLWGFGEMGQLANGGEDESTPNEVELKGRHVYKAACGGQHTLLLLRPKDL